MPKESNSSLRRLRKRVERALASGQRGSEVLRDLELMVRDYGEQARDLAQGEQCVEANRDVLFAHRQLAELRLEESPWQAALHLRQLIAASAHGGNGRGANGHAANGHAANGHAANGHGDSGQKDSAQDDGVHALMGLCQALLGNFRAAISSYRRAVQISPRNPWYHHNLGHLIDVGLGDAKSALRHLQLAYDIQPLEDEIGASLAHCFARLGRLDEAHKLAAEAIQNAPSNREHRVLIEWIEQGAPGRAPAGATQRPRVSPPATATSGDVGESSASETPDRENGERSASSRRSSSASNSRSAGTPAKAATGGASLGREIPLAQPVARLLAARMPEVGFGRDQVQRAQALWTDYCALVRGSRSGRVDAFAAAVEYALAQIDGSPDVTQAGLARRYRVSAASISTRYTDIRSALSLVARDPRYCASAQA
jgi:tetratricopeptide (TPR) repeat protein